MFVSPKILEIIRKIHNRLYPVSLPRLCLDYQGQAASDCLKNLLSDEAPCLIARFGANELNCVLNYLSITSQDALWRKIWQYIAGRGHGFWWEWDIKMRMTNNAGFFPGRTEDLNKFAELMLSCMPQIDVLGSWLEDEALIATYLNKAKKVSLLDLEPYHHVIPWSAALRGKKVLVIHPFSDTIKNQYQNREKLFVNPDVLPEFQLKTIKAVQSIAGTRPEYPDWFAALDAMKKQVAEIDFDIALIGCGAYGLPLAAQVKISGKKAVHLGGALQILFGIKGRRWENNYGYDTKFYNKYWVRPGPSETPVDFQKVEDGCYW
ncbi:hypothetical protein NO1_1437 [Candidatus Termititenax aidoneus]|uniref:Uncharacterized protein n=1 Tax=Termititenax aidoneus TaxID=2218524 RepID=A0A388TBN0_TERA1|nr:hypothetical protein NO1_1437 [Candidatus Termititenax aidoneus]